MKSSRLDGTIYGWAWLIGLCLVLFGSAMWAGFGLLQMGQLLGFAPNGVTLIAISALGCVGLGLLVLGARWLLKPRA